MSTLWHSEIALELRLKVFQPHALFSLYFWIRHVTYFAFAWTRPEISFSCSNFNTNEDHSVESCATWSFFRATDARQWPYCRDPCLSVCLSVWVCVRQHHNFWNKRVSGLKLCRRVPWGKPGFKFLYGPRGMFGGRGGIFVIEEMPFSAWGTKAKKIGRKFFVSKCRVFAFFVSYITWVIQKTGFGDFHGHYILSIVSIEVNTIVDFPNFNFGLCYKWNVTVVKHCYAEWLLKIRIGRLAGFHSQLAAYSWQVDKSLQLFWA